MIFRTLIIGQVNNAVSADRGDHKAKNQALEDPSVQGSGWWGGPAKETVPSVMFKEGASFLLSRKTISLFFSSTLFIYLYFSNILQLDVLDFPHQEILTL